MSLSHSIVIPVHGHAALTHRCLEILLDQPECRQAEIAVVDDGSGDETADVVPALGDRVRLIARPTSGGFAAACNEGARETVGETIVFLNNDTAPQEGWLAALLDYAAAHPKAAVVGSKLLYPDGTVQHAGVTFCQDRFPRHLYAGFPGDHPAVSNSRPMGAVSAACALARRDPFEQVGGFDEEFRNGLEDVDLCLRLGEQNHEIHYCAESVVWHLEYASRGSRSAERRAGERRYLSRWGSRVRPDDLSYYLEDGLLRIRYEETFPARLRVSPHLASIEDDGREREANRLLNLRSRQAYELLREAARLTVLRAEEDAGLLGWVGDADGEGRARSAIGSSEAAPTDHTRVGELRALLAEAHEGLHRRDEELARQLCELQQAVLESTGAEAVAGERRPKPVPSSERLSYLDVPPRLRSLVRSAVPRGHTVIVVSKGDDELLRLDGRKGWHFPRDRNGEYSGHYPRDSAEAIAHLEELRSMGGEYFALPATALWWLEHYAAFRDHLDAHHVELARDHEAGVIYGLQPRSREPASGSGAGAERQGASA
jgi:GT2 family glycosyltransferase